MFRTPLSLCLAIVCACGGTTPPIESAAPGSDENSLPHVAPLDAVRVEQLVRCSLQLDFRLEPSDEEIEACLGLQREFEMVQGLCSASLISRDQVNNRFVGLSVVEAASRCEEGRCVVWVREESETEPAADEEQPTRPLHLQFEGDRLVQVMVGDVQPMNDPLPEPPSETVAPTCSPAFSALVERRVGEDLWQIRGTGGDEYTAERLCGDAALARLDELGTRWECDGTYCESLDMCGNNCASMNTVELDGSMLVLGAFDGMEGGGGLPLDAEKLAQLRSRVECGASAPVQRDEFAAASEE